MKKKLIIFMPSIEGGGVEKNLFIVSNYLVKNFKSVSLITISKKYKNKFDKKINFISLKSDYWDTLSRRTKYFLAIILLIRELLTKENSIIFAFQANIYAIITCKLLNKKIIVRSNSAPAGWSQNIFKKFIYKFFLKKADIVMANSRDFIKSLKSEFNVNAHCIYNPLNKNEIIKKSKIKTKKYFESKNKLKILNIGRFVDQKDQMTFLKALNKIQNKIEFEARIMGRGIKENELQNFINENNLKSKVKLIKFSKNPYPIIQQTEILILSSKYEGLPNILLEAQALKRFIISSNCPTGPREILLNGKCGLLFKVEDSTDLSKKILYYNENKIHLKKLIKLGFKKLDRFDYYFNLKKYLNLIKKL